MDRQRPAEAIALHARGLALVGLLLLVEEGNECGRVGPDLRLLSCRLELPLGLADAGRGFFLCQDSKGTEVRANECKACRAK